MKDKKVKYKDDNGDKNYIFWGAVITVVLLTVWFGFSGESYNLGGIILDVSILTALILGRLIIFITSKKHIHMERKNIMRTNPYIYYRELPNKYGIGITSLLFDSTIEIYKDIVAVILDLCARKYLKLKKKEDKYTIQVLKSADDELLSNERYILNLIIEHNLKNLDYKQWYNLCLSDGKNLGLYEKPHYNFEEYFTYDIKKRLIVMVIISIIIVYFLLWVAQGKPIGNLIEWLKFILFSVLSSGLVSIFYCCVIMLKETAYYNVDKNTLQKTKEGKKELQKLYSFKAFIRDFGSFVDKNVDEVELWDRYLSYAQVFGLTKEIMNTGYKQLVKNASFEIDDIDNISLDNIEVLN